MTYQRLKFRSGRRDKRGKMIPASLWILSVIALPTLMLAVGFYEDHVKQLPTGVWYIPSKTKAANPFPITEEHNIAIVKALSPYRFVFQAVDKEGNLQGSQFTQDICTDYETPEIDFRVGTILNRLIHTDEPGCWSLNPDKHCGWFKRRDEKTSSPIYAKGVTYGN